MRRLVYFGPWQESWIDILRKESPQLEVCHDLDQLRLALSGSRPEVLVGELSAIPDFVEFLRFVDANSAGVPVIALSAVAVAATLRQEVLGVLGERGTLLAPADASSFRATIRCWLLPANDPALLDSTALARIYTAGGRALADRLLSSYVSTAASSVARAQRFYLEKQNQHFINVLESLEHQSGSVGAVDVQDAIEEVLDEFGEKACVSAEQWLQLERAVAAAVRVLAEQTRQDRTV